MRVRAHAYTVPMNPCTIYHNPRCSKSRQTLELLRQRNNEPEVIEYLQTPPSIEELDTILNKLDKGPQDIVRTREAAYKDLGLEEKSLTRKDWIEVLVANPILIERPIVVTKDAARIGRPPENVLEIV